MTETSQLKSRVSRESVKQLDRHLREYDPSFPSRRFVKRACAGLDVLELKARVSHVAHALATCLPADFELAAEVIRGANQRSVGSDSEATFFVHWPVCTYIERHGLEHFDAAFETMHGLTGLASCEFAIRPFLEREPERAFAVLRRWVEDDDHHVRRLVSEGTRPRLPWGPRLRALQADPSPSIELLDRLADDDELYVRRSVANHLNDISKDHPDRAVAVARRWTKTAERSNTANVEWVVRHALRSLLKGGHAGALALQGFGPPRAKLTSFEVSPGRLKFGQPLHLSLDVAALADGEWMIDYAVHRVLANGKLAAKVFKWTRRTVRRGERLELDKSHPIRAISTRKYYDGLHRCELLINGESFATREFTLTGTTA